MAEQKVVKAAVVQAGSALFDTPKTLEKLADLAADAARQGAEVVLFPEAFVGGYPKGVDFGSRVGTRSEEGRALFARYFASAISLDSAEAEAIARVARQCGITLVTGIIERLGSTLYCASVGYDPEGKRIHHHRKLMPTAHERLIWGQGDGSTLRITDSPVGRLGAAICWENYMPLLRMSMYLQGIEIYCAPTVDSRESWLPTMRMIALEGRCFVLSASQFLLRSDCPPDYHPIQGEAPETVLINGGACIIDPMGKVLVEPVFDCERIALAELDMSLIPKARFDLDVAGHYARPDIFELSVDTRSRLVRDFTS